MLYEANILLLRQLDRFRQAASSLADEQTVHHALALWSRADGQDEQNGPLVQEMLHAVVEDLPHGRMVFSHHALHAVNCADHVRFVDHIAAAHADKEVFGVVRHADHFMRHDLTGRNDEIIAFIHHAAVDLHADRLVPETLCDFFQIACRNLTDLDHIMPPVVDDHVFIRNALEHSLPLSFGNRLMRAECGHDIDLCAALGQQMIIDACDLARLRVKACEVRREDEHLLQRSACQ